MRFVIAGFNPFNGAPVNPSQQVVEQFPEGKDLAISKIILPTCCGDAMNALEAELRLRDEKYFLLLSGYAHMRKRIALERFALNVRQYRIPDNRGHQWHEDYLDIDAPEAIRTNVPVTAIEQELTSQGFPCEVSNNAGTFVCNEIYFKALQLAKDSKNCVGVLFVHVPALNRYLRLKESGEASNPISTAGDESDLPEIVDETVIANVINSYAQAMKIIVDFLNHHFEKH